MDIAVKFESEITRCLPLLEKDEWALANARDNLVTDIKSEEAFQSVVSVLSLASKQCDEYTLVNCCWLASKLANISGTTEHPEGLIETLKKLYSHALGFNQAAANEVKIIAAWYRAENAL